LAPEFSYAAAPVTHPAPGRRTPFMNDDDTRTVGVQTAEPSAAPAQSRDDSRDLVDPEHARFARLLYFVAHFSRLLDRDLAVAGGSNRDGEVVLLYGTTTELYGAVTGRDGTVAGEVAFITIRDGAVQRACWDADFLGPKTHYGLLGLAHETGVEAHACTIRAESSEGILMTTRAAQQPMGS